MRGALVGDLVARARACVDFDPDLVVGGWTRAGIAAIYSNLRHALLALLVEQKRRERAASVAPAEG